MTPLSLLLVLQDPAAAPIPATSVQAPVMIELSVLLRWLILPGTVAALAAFLAIASFDRFLARRMRAPESKTADVLRDVLGAPDERRHTATWVLDVLGERHEETKGFIGRLYARELRERAEVFQLAKDAHRMAEHNASQVQRLSESLAVLPALSTTFSGLETTMRDMQATMREMTERLARMEGAIEGWDGRERRAGGRGPR